MGLELSLAAPVDPLPAGRFRTREAVLEILSRTWPLGVLAIHSALRHEYGLKVTYQAVHKTVSSLRMRQVLVRWGRGYAINLAWVERVEERLKTLKANYGRAFAAAGAKGLPEGTHDA